MKKNLVLLITLVGIANSITSQASQSCNTIDLNKTIEGDQCVTTTGTVFKRVNKIGFGQAWKDPSGMIWSQTLGTKEHVLVAYKRCKRLTGSLPTKEDFERFQGYFENGKYGYLTYAAKDDLQGIMPEMKNGLYWTSSPNTEEKYRYTESAFAFHGSFGKLSTFDYGTPLESLCVSR